MKARRTADNKSCPEKNLNSAINFLFTVGISASDTEVFFVQLFLDKKFYFVQFCYFQRCS